MRAVEGPASQAQWVSAAPPPTSSSCSSFAGFHPPIRGQHPKLDGSVSWGCTEEACAESSRLGPWERTVPFGRGGRSQDSPCWWELALLWRWEGSPRSSVSGRAPGGAARPRHLGSPGSCQCHFRGLQFRLMLGDCLWPAEHILLKSHPQVASAPLLLAKNLQ